MAGLYLHIPFCKQACNYCNFHFSTSSKLRPEVLSAMKKELRLRKDYLTSELDSIYFGGGTPSILNVEEFQLLFESIFSYFSVKPNAEITIEANPDDLTSEKITELRRLPFNRFSVGIQSFKDHHLQWMNRAHTAAEALGSVKKVQDAGFENISIDLIYGIPKMTISEWTENIETAIGLNVPHISSYCLTVEPKTTLGKMVSSGRQQTVNDDEAEIHFLMLTEMLAKAGLHQYEVSNFAKPGMYSRHNTSYWKGATYLGIGPSAHSFNGSSRSWNVANNARYVNAFKSNGAFSESELIDTKTAYNEYVMTGLRTVWGIDLSEIKDKFQVDVEKTFPGVISGMLKNGSGTLSNNKLILTKRGFLFADGLASDLFLV